MYRQRPDIEKLSQSKLIIQLTSKVNNIKRERFHSFERRMIEVQFMTFQLIHQVYFRQTFTHDTLKANKPSDSG